MAIVVAPHFTIPDWELERKFSASGGPGGQHANKAATRVELTWSIEDSVILTTEQRATLVRAFGSSVRVVVDDERSQLRNRTIAEARLAQRLRRAMAKDKPRRATKPTKGSQRRRLDAKRRKSQTKAMRQRPSVDD